ncbi:MULTISPECIES: methyltransferase domain-containing protein [Sphingomonas]|uniref:methyltransferase domain-containing protein n=1 Tax=Sphingomonas TaxID=13687 RepID=UPI000DEEF258|nr:MULTISPECIES: methyltransferase domain-containing protein [Sphingomonas]
MRQALPLVLLLTACRAQAGGEAVFPPAGRDVAPIVSGAYSTEDARDRIGEFDQVMAQSGVTAGMSVADVGAGEGYYTVRLSPLVGPSGRVLAQDVVAATRDSLAQRVQREKLDNVAVRLGQPADPMLPPASFDRIFLVHMYHEVTDPYAFLWHLVGGLKQGGEVVVVDALRPVKRHGMPPPELKCEFAALGLSAVRFAPLHGGDSYLMSFKQTSARPAPSAIKPCSDGRSG